MSEDTGKPSRDVLGPLRPEADDLAFVDGLTGLCNQRLLAQLFDEKWDELISLSGSFALVMLDLDLFKEVNDRYGHLSGDEVLRVTARILQKTFRESDLLFRYGGDEFVVLLPGATAREAAILGERAREAMEAHEFFDPEEKTKIEVPVSFSVGVAAYPENGDSGRSVLAVADDALYVEKRTQVAWRRRKRTFATAALLTFIVLALVTVLVRFVDGAKEPVEVPVVVEPAVEAPVVDAEREALLSEIAELQNQIAALQASGSDAEARPNDQEIEALEEKIRALSAELAKRSVTEPPPPASPPVGEPEPEPEPPATPLVRRPEPPAVVETPRPTAQKRIVLVPPKLTKRVTPRYPPLAIERGLEATVDLELVVDETGRVVEAKVLGDPIGFGFEEAARDAAFKSQWMPATQDGVPIRMRTTLQVRFQTTR